MFSSRAWLGKCSGFSVKWHRKKEKEGVSFPFSASPPPRAKEGVHLAALDVVHGYVDVALVLPVAVHRAEERVLAAQPQDR